MYNIINNNDKCGGREYSSCEEKEWVGVKQTLNMQTTMSTSCCNKETLAHQLLYPSPLHTYMYWYLCLFPLKMFNKWMCLLHDAIGWWMSITKNHS